jgi:hypothetical protein
MNVRHSALFGLALLGCAVSNRGVDINGPLLNGTSAGGAPLDVVLLAQGVILPSGEEARDVVVEGSALTGAGRSGLDFIGARLRGRDVKGGSVQLRIDAIALAAPRPQAREGDNDVHLYTVSVAAGEGAGKGTPLCGGDNQAVLLAGRWDYRAGVPGAGGRVSSAKEEATLACLDSAIAKCIVRLGYKPWPPRVSQGEDKPLAALSLAPLHEACVRAVRADYCGNGESLTRQGERINFHDTFGVQRDEADWAPEAEWTPAGARCVDGTRLTRPPGQSRVTVREYLQRTCPGVVEQGGRTCVQRKDAGEPLLFTEYPPR